MNAILGQALRRYISKSAVSQAQIQGTAATAGHEGMKNYLLIPKLRNFFSPIIIFLFEHY
jgi:hypothetical protein